MLGISARQSIFYLDKWDNIITERKKNLTIASRFYLATFYFASITIAVLTACNIVFASVVLLAEDPTVTLIMECLILTFQILLSLFMAYNITVEPKSIAKYCSTSQKSYRVLLDEIRLSRSEFKNRKDQDTPSIENSYQLLYYSSREQLIIQGEPTLLWIGRNSQQSLDLANNYDENDTVITSLLKSNLDTDSKSALMKKFYKSEFESINIDPSESEIELYDVV